MSIHRRAELALVFATLMFGITFPLIHESLTKLDAMLFVAARFFFASVLFVPILLHSRPTKHEFFAVARQGIALGALNWFIFVSQTLGLTTISSNRAAFITGTSVAWVPFLAPFFAGSRPLRNDFIAAAVVLIGLFFLTDPLSGGFSIGDFWVVGCAFGIAIYIHGLRQVVARPHHEASLVFWQLLAVAVLGIAFTRSDAFATAQFDPQVLISIAFCSVGATVGAFWLQTKYQVYVSPQKTALIFSLEPVFATICAWIMIGERLSVGAIIGSVIILSGIVFSEIKMPMVAKE